MKLWTVTIQHEVPVFAECEDDAEDIVVEAMQNGDISIDSFYLDVIELRECYSTMFDKAIPFGTLEDNPNDLTVAQLREKLKSEEEQRE